MHTLPQPLEQHLVAPGQSSSLLQSTAQIPGPLGVGHKPERRFCDTATPKEERTH